MKLKHMDINKQLKIVFSILIGLVSIMSILTIWQTNKLSQQTEILYDHPLQVRRALDNITIQRESMSVAMRDMILSDNEEEIDWAYDKMLRDKAQIPTHIDILRKQYLGPAEDIEAINTAYVLWEEALMRNASFILQGNTTFATENIQAGGDVEEHLMLLRERIEIVDEYAKNKADELYDTSNESRKNIVLTSAILVLILIGTMYVMSRRIYRNIQNPLDELVEVVKQAQNGILSVRSSILEENEFGELTNGLNGMLENIESTVILNKKNASLSEMMLVAGDEFAFFESLLRGLLTHTNGQLGGVYLLSEDKKTFELFTSIGMENNQRVSFDAESMEGELGLALGSNKIQMLKQISESTRFIFPAATGNVLPTELITVPVAKHNEMIAFITMGSIVGFDEITLELLEESLPVIGARIQSVLDAQQKKQIKETLEIQNSELEMQKSELDAQRLELGEQNRELERQKVELSEVNRLKTNFLSNMSHELRTPLNSVIALSGVLERRLKGQISDEEHNYLEVIGRSGKSLLDMINDILDIARIESGREEIELAAFDLTDLIQELTKMLKPLAEEKGIQINLQGVDDQFPIVSDERKLRHILQNLLSNAVKFTEEGQVEVVASKNGNSLVVTVSDSGIGIAKEYHESIFDEFRQADSSTTRNYGGTGLGLAIAKKHAELLGGRISVDSILGEGSIFTVIIPILSMREYHEKHSARQKLKNEFAQKPVAKPWGEGLAFREKQHHLLIVEDSEPAIIQLRDVFSQEGYRITVARDGAEAIRLIEENRPDGIILDLMMPKVDGFQVLKTIRGSEWTAHIPVLILTAKHIVKEELSRLKQNHIHQLIQKGNINLEELKLAVTTMFQPEEAVVIPPQKEFQDFDEKPIVLVVEDNPDNRLTAKAILKESFQVIEAEDGEKAVDVASERVPDLILMDIALPGMDGVEAFKAIRKKEELAHIPIIALTASAMTTDREIFLAYGFDAFIPKPIIEDQFMKTIKGVLYGG